MHTLQAQLKAGSVLVLVVGLVIFQSGFARADDHTASGALDGLVFFGQMGPDDQGDYVDSLSFQEGMFWSDLCIRCGFEPGKYWTRSEPDGIHFRGEVQGGYGTFVYEGRIVDDEAIVEVVWKKERWYWTSSRTLDFNGRTKPDSSPYPYTQANQIAIDALLGDLPDFCW